MNDMSGAPVAQLAQVNAHQLKAWLRDGDEIAVLDVREHGQYGERHLFFGVTAPYSRLELDVRRLVPRLATRLVVYDEGDGCDVAGRAALRLAELGYGCVHVLEGGALGWQKAGYQLFAGVNVPSKTFGELAEQVFHTPRITAGELSSRIARGDRLAVLDGRPVSEYRKMSIPTAICCPNGELALRVGQIVDDPGTPIVINCAGRTRSIIGAQNLIDMQIANPVFALENGTQGWYLADLALDHGADRLYPPAPAESELPHLRKRAQAFAQAWQVSFITAEDLARMQADDRSSTYLCDVRTPEEFRAGTLPGAQSAPGGQLVQATDQYVATRHGQIIVFDGEGVRALVIAARLRQMGWNAMVLQEGMAAALAQVMPSDPVLPELAMVSAPELARLGGQVKLIDVRTSSAYREGHLAGSIWAIRPRLSRLNVGAAERVVLIASEKGVAQLVAGELMAAGVQDIRLHLAVPEEWTACGLEIKATPDSPPDAECIDFLFFVHDRHSGNKAAALQYLAWETNLLAQIDADERASYRI